MASKIKALLLVMFLVLSVPFLAQASIATPWNATSTDKGSISPNLINGNAPWLAISSTGTSTFANGINITNGCFSVNGTCVISSNLVTSVFGRTGAVTAQSGDYNTSQVTESGNLYFTNARAIASTLTGFVAGAGTVSSSDTILTAIQKLAGNAASYLTNITGLVTAGTNITITGSGTSGSPYVINASGSTGGGLSTTSPWIVGQLAQVASNGSVNSIATSSLFTFPWTIAQGGTNATSQTTNGVAYYDGGKITSGSTFLTDGTQVGVGPNPLANLFQISGTYTTTAGYLFRNAGILTSSNTGQQDLQAVAANFNTSGGSVTTLVGFESAPGILATSSSSPSFFFNGIQTGLSTQTGLSGTIPNGAGLYIVGPTIGAGNNPITNYSTIYSAPITNGNGITSGTVTNEGLRFQSMTAAAASGGTVNNYGALLNLSTGSGAGTTNNRGIYITGNGGTGGAGTTNNFALYSDSTANSYLAGNVGIGTTTPQSLLSVYGDMEIGTGAGTPTIRAYSSSRAANGYVTLYNSANGNVTLGTTFGSGNVILSPGASGNVGIGTTSPFMKLSVAGNTFLGGNLTATGTVLVQNEATTSTATFYLQGTGTSFTTATAGDYFGVNMPTTFTGSAIDIRQNGTQRFNVSSAGTVSTAVVGNLSSANNSQIQFNAAGLFLGRNVADSNPAAIISQTNAASTGDILQLKNSAGTVLSVAQTGTTTASNGFNITSGCFSIAGTCIGSGGGSGTVTSVGLSAPTGLTVSGSPVTTSGTLALSLTAGYNIPLTASTTDWNTAYVNRITSLTTSGTSGAATLTGNTLNIPNYANTTYTASTGLTLTGTAFSVNTSQNISTLSNLTSNGLIKTSGGTGALSIATAGTDYQAPITLTTTGSGAATFISNTLNIPTPAAGYSPVGTAGQIPFFSTTNTLTATSGIFLNPTNGNFGVGTTSPFSLSTILGAFSQGSPFSIWGDSSTGTTTAVEVISSSGTWTKPAGLYSAVVQVVGAGATGADNNTGGVGGGSTNFAAATPCIAVGGGGGAYKGTGSNGGNLTSRGGVGNNAGTGTGGAGSGGGSGDLETCNYLSANIASTVTVTIGQPGTGSTPGTGFFSGGSSAVSGGGGQGGGSTAVGANNSSATGGNNANGASSGGTSTGGNSGQANSGTTQGNGANSPLGNTGGGTGLAGNATTPSYPLVLSYGAGGAGSVSTGHGSGAQGVVIITETFANTASSKPAFFSLPVMNSVGILTEYFGIGSSSPSATLSIDAASSSPILMLAGWSQVFTGTGSSLQHYVYELIDAFGHLITGGPAPTANSCAGFAVTGDDRTGVVTFTSASSCSVTFANAYPTTPTCIVSPSSSNVALGVQTISTTGFTVTGAGAFSGFRYICQAHQ